MRKFQFKFESVEKVRKSKENDALRVLAEAQRHLQAARDRRASLANDLQQSLARRENLGKEPIRALAFQIESEFIAGTKLRIVQADQGIQRATRGMEKALRAYLHTRRQTKMMEVLREKAAEDYKKECAKHEQRELNDLYVMRARVTKESA